ncbi:Putative phenylalanine aminotransferase OS=Tsukamurella paurometabola (strain ATCC 8368 / DSM/ CCUG 35730 / CIP 100753 / JCM 10117 / KCTC 9821 / NBRC 16120/ NCIMB 702349 / NCTC 13040) OX=521096 GN=pat PE=3 SV=1 [Tsukamurella paurometabola]|uniref:Aromatic amino acid aminotransferase n=1 Tax=Tsukamurella paurometabola (strain ATCC 8368 / DSM 20162 / CCUG 35730 / CIP 100753 / JCM 10117 / KCTC 9821 / NBRC 16120 / NCIMB 702349 / NCTC 13040) TaxID=521096 RepID=D5UNF0_TSUPD|nr:histidinol-phosphate transaminase [Tsukamurella paurometabola]ADG80645.1 histidinol-phosphate aminotransferase [Tsukamurella paurometabola DSM 20162]SUP40412.1 Putative phenylalanine aminotransferase [Tsukamurella paurometabola]
MASANEPQPGPLGIRADLDTLPAYVPGKALPSAIKLSSNEVVEGPLPSVATALAEALASANRYPDNGAVALRAELAKLTGATEEQLHVGCGSVALCQDLVQVTCRPGDEVIFAWRSFEAYPIITRVVGAVPMQVPLTPDAVHDLDAMAAAITDRTRLIFVCNPNNPTGTTVSEQQLEEFLAAVPPHVIVALDEAYYEYHRGNEQSGERIDGTAVAARHRNVIALRTFSKAYGLAGLRVGYAIGDPELIGALTKVHLPFSVSVAAQAAAIASLRANDELLARTEAVVTERIRVRDALRKNGFEVPHTQANFVWLPLGEDAARFTADAAEAGILVRGFAGDGVRVTVTTPEENDAFLSFAKEWSK